MPMQPIELQIITLLQAGRVITVNWDCGGDEGFVYTQIDGLEQQANFDDPNDFPYGLDQYLTAELELPDVGEFELHGKGRIFQEDKEVVIEYESEYTDYDDGEWMADFNDEQLAEMGYSRPAPADPQAAAVESEAPGMQVDTEMSEEYSGRLVLFKLV